MLKTVRDGKKRARRAIFGEWHVRALMSPGFLGLGLLMVVAGLSGSAGYAVAEDNLLVRIPWKDASELDFVESAGHVLRYSQPGFAVFEVREGELAVLRSAGVTAEVVDTVCAGKRYWLLTPADPASRDSLAAYGRLVPLGGGLYLLGVDETLEPRLPGFVSSLTLLPERMGRETGFPRGRPAELGVGRGTTGVLGIADERFLGAVASEVNEDSIRATVHFLSFDDDSAKLRSRYTFYGFCPDSRPDSLAIPLWLKAKLEAYFGGRGTASLDSFVFRYAGVNYTRYNVVGRIPGRVPGSGTFVLCAHYDSNGGRTVYPDPDRRWDWRVDPAPGADDNGSGVASVLECARALSDLEFDFDMEFVLFSAEEQGLFGSAAYVASRKAQGYNMLGALNFDMQAYREAADSTFLRTNASSDWLSAHIKNVSESLFDSIGVRVGLVQVVGPYDSSDHSSFWSAGFDGVHFFEQGGSPVVNPYYHTIDDTAGTLNYSLAWKVARLGAASVAYFATTTDPWDLEVLSGDLLLRLEGRTLSIQEGDVGSVLSIGLSFHNLGAAVPETISVRVGVYDGTPSSGRLMGERLISVATTPIPSGGSPVIEPLSWLLTESDVGAHSIYLVIDAGEAEGNRDNNVVSKALLVRSATLAIKKSFVFPNPSNVSLADVRLRVFVTREATLTQVDVYDISGRKIGGCRDGDCRCASLVPGDNDVALSNVLSGGAIAPGVYLYRLSVDDGAQKKVDYGRFAIVR
ncbi:MAG: M28 family peptidase [Candidatus Eisenbacteria bacterium]|nr:M28 family peptidase [Candidatus Eisenbacteria bacterium]